MISGCSVELSAVDMTISYLVFGFVLLVTFPGTKLYRRLCVKLLGISCVFRLS